jgi:hypothetical protein
VALEFLDSSTRKTVLSVTATDLPRTRILWFCILRVGNLDDILDANLVGVNILGVRKQNDPAELEVNRGVVEFTGFFIPLLPAFVGFQNLAGFFRFPAENVYGIVSQLNGFDEDELFDVFGIHG